MSSEQEIPSYKRQQNATEILRSQHEVLTRLYEVTSIQNEILRDPMSGLDNSIVKHQVRVKIEDVNMPFSAMVGLMVKVAIASIPAIIILWMIFTLLGVMLVMLVTLLGIVVSLPSY